MKVSCARSWARSSCLIIAFRKRNTLCWVSCTRASRASSKAPQRLKRTHEGVLRQVLGEILVPHHRLQKAKHAVLGLVHQGQPGLLDTPLAPEGPDLRRRWIRFLAQCVPHATSERPPSHPFDTPPRVPVAAPRGVVGATGTGRSGSTGMCRGRRGAFQVFGAGLITG